MRKTTADTLPATQNTRALALRFLRTYEQTLIFPESEMRSDSPAYAVLLERMIEDSNALVRLVPGLDPSWIGTSEDVEPFARMIVEVTQVTV